MRTSKKLFAMGLFKSMLMLTIMVGMQFSSYAQSHELKVSPLRFAGVHALTPFEGASDGYMVLHTASGGDWNFNLFSNELTEIKEGTIETPRNSFFNSLTYNGDYTLLNFVVNAFSQSITYIVLDKDGIETARTTRNETPMLRRGEQFFPNVYNHPENGFVITQTFSSGRRAGYTVEHLDNQLNTQWSLDFQTDKGNAHVYDVKSAGERIFVLEATERSGNTRNTRLHSIDANIGQHIYTMELTDDEFTYFPSALLPMEDGTITISGTYFNGSRISIKNSRGLFFLSVSPDGETTGMNIFDWRELRPLLRTSVPDWFFKVMPDVWIHALEPEADGSFTAVAELYRYSGEVRREEKGELKESYHRIRLLDFMLFGFAPDGQMLYAERIERPHMVIKLDSEFSGGSGSLANEAGSGALRRARAMKKSGAFTYRFHQKQDNRFNLAFTSFEAKKHHAWFMDLNSNFNSLKLDLTHAKPQFISYMQIIDLCANQSGFGFILSELNTRSFDDSEAYWRGVLPAGANSMLTYEYMPLGGKLKLNIANLSEEFSK
ncbi:MAG: DUF6770 family protein [Bacteroidales bacterium]